MTSDHLVERSWFKCKYSEHSHVAGPVAPELQDDMRPALIITPLKGTVSMVWSGRVSVKR